MRYQKLDRWFGRCTQPGCKYRRVTNTFIMDGGRTVSYDGTNRASLVAAGYWCADHNRHLDWNQLKGRYSAERECNAVCMGAVGPSCDCQCGGENHGKSHC